MCVLGTTPTSISSAHLLGTSRGRVRASAEEPRSFEPRQLEYHSERISHDYLLYNQCLCLPCHSTCLVLFICWLVCQTYSCVSSVYRTYGCFPSMFLFDDDTIPHTTPTVGVFSSCAGSVNTHPAFCLMKK